MIGVGAMIHYLSGGSEHAALEYAGLKIMSAELGGDNKLRLSFDNGAVIAVWDDGQSCCESRYITTDDDVSSVVGHTLRSIEAKEAPDGMDNGEVHEQVFVEIATDAGFITLVNHNEHNGYYGGFGLTITEEQPARL